MFDLETIKRINNEAVQKHEDAATREATLRRRLKGKIATKNLASYTRNELENAAYYLLAPAAKNSRSNDSAD